MRMVKNKNKERPSLRGFMEKETSAPGEGAPVREGRTDEKKNLNQKERGRPGN